MKRTLIGAIILALTTISPVYAATGSSLSSVVLTPFLPTLTTNFSGGDDLSQILTAPTMLLLIGTIETTTPTLVTSTPLGGSDGYIAAIDSRSSHLWDLRLGTSGDDVATAGYIDALGNIWVIGSSAVATGTTAPPSGLTRLTVWEISSTGTLENTYTKDLADPTVPTAISFNGKNFLIKGSTSKSGSTSFNVGFTTLGKFGAFKYAKTPTPLLPGFFSAKSAAYNWQSYVTSTPVKGVLGITPHHPITLLLKSSLKNGAIIGAYSLQGVPINMQYQSGIGVVVATLNSGSYFLTIVHTK